MRGVLFQALIVSLAVAAQRAPRQRGFLKQSELPAENLLTVGVLTLPTSEDSLDFMTSSQYLTQMVQIWMISGGLNPVFIPYNAPDDELYKILSQVNGVFFTGGDLQLYDPVTDVPHLYTVTASKIVDYSIKATDKGDYFPILGVCQGHELLHMLVANDSKALGWSSAENLNLNTEFRVAKTESRMLNYFDSVIIDAMASQNLLMHLHHRGILLDAYSTYPILNEFFKIVSTNNINGVEIVSTAEAHNYPIYLVQYHPEAVYDPVSDLKSYRVPINF